MADLQHLMRPGTLQLPALPPLALYVHLPWCLRKCPYCDFNSHEYRDGRETAISGQEADDEVQEQDHGQRRGKRPRTNKPVFSRPGESVISATPDDLNRNNTQRDDWYESRRDESGSPRPLRQR